MLWGLLTTKKNLIQLEFSLEMKRFSKIFKAVETF